MQIRCDIIAAFILALFCTVSSAGVRACEVESVRLSLEIFADKTLNMELDGQRMLELLGRSSQSIFYDNVEMGEAAEPGWDVIDVSDDFKVVFENCELVGESIVYKIDVILSKGWWISRDEFGSRDELVKSYDVGSRDGRYYLVPPLPQPTISSSFATKLIGNSPYDASALRGLLNEIKR